jgi:hypothetical protein
MEYHATTQRVVLFGGRDATGTLLNDTWLWDGANWASVAVPAPAARSGSSLAFESTRGTCLLFGGEGVATPPELGDTWEWNGASWQSRPSAQSPAPRSASALAHDPVRGRTVLTGGSAAGIVIHDAWEWDGVNWLAQSAVPPAPGTRALAFHARRGRILATGAGARVFEWDGSTWTVSSLPGAGAFKDYDSRRGTLVAPATAWCVYMENSMVRSPVEGPGCGAVAGAPGLTTTGWPTLGDPWFGFETITRQPATPCVLGLAPASGSLPLGNGCDWQLAGETLFFQTTDARGYARWPCTIPLDPNWVGIEFHTQGAALDAAAPLGFGLTNHLHFTVRR